MLVLSRKQEEEIIIDGHIVVRVVGVVGDRVQLGIVAPKGVPIHRREIQDKIDRGEQR